MFSARAGPCELSVVSPATHAPASLSRSQILPSRLQHRLHTEPRPAAPVRTLTVLTQPGRLQWDGTLRVSCTALGGSCAFSPFLLLSAALWPSFLLDFGGLWGPGELSIQEDTHLPRPSRESIVFDDLNMKYPSQDHPRLEAGMAPLGAARHRGPGSPPPGEKAQRHRREPVCGGEAPRAVPTCFAVLGWPPRLSACTPSVTSGWWFSR